MSTRYFIQRISLSVSALMCALTVFAATYHGRVVDEKGQAVAYATVYPEQQPEEGTATNTDGRFTFQTELPRHSKVIISFIGYEKLTLTLAELETLTTQRKPLVLKEQPIALQEMVVAAKPSKQRNKNKQMAALLHAVYVKMQQEFSDENTRYQVVSDVKMNSEGSVWGMEQMIADIIVLPEKGAEGRDSVQFSGRYCKRFFPAGKRAQADSILAGQTIDRLAGEHQQMAHRAINAVDSGVVVHRALFAMGNMLYDFEQAMNDIRHWTVSNESEGETVLTHTEKITKYLGLFQLTFQRHYIVDSHTYAVLRFSEHAEVKVTIPFGYKLNADQLELLNLVNMDDERIQKFRLRKLRGTTDLNTIYQRQDGHVYILEKNMYSNSRLIGTKDTEIPIIIKATQRVTGLQTKDVTPMTPSQITRRVKREIVEIY